MKDQTLAYLKSKCLSADVAFGYANVRETEINKQYKTTKNQVVETRREEISMYDSKRAIM